VIAQIYPATIVKVVEGPVCADGMVFWRVENSEIPGGSGWTAEGDLANYYLEPYAYQPEYVTLSAYGVSFTVPGDWSGIPEAKIVPAHVAEPFTEVIPEHIIITLTTYPFSHYAYPKYLEIIVYSRNDISPSLAAELYTLGLPPAEVEAHVKAIANGERGIYQFGQHITPIVNDKLFYRYSGMTNDEEHVILVVIPVWAPFLAESDTDLNLPADGIPFGAPGDVWNFSWPDYYSAVQEQLNAASENIFTPSLEVLDALVESIQVK
jgi:hypothetical protein